MEIHVALTHDAELQLREIGMEWMEDPSVQGQGLSHGSVHDPSSGFVADLETSPPPSR